MSKIILINGKKRAGKDYLAEKMKIELNRLNYSTEIMAFADPIKEIIACTFDIDLNCLNEYKNNQTEIFIQDCHMTGDRNFRTILQRFGTEAMQSTFGKKVWVDLLKKKAHFSECHYVIVPDFRFIAENIGDVTITITNTDLEDENDKHASENELNDFKFDYEINNTGHHDISLGVKELVHNILHKEFFE